MCTAEHQHSSAQLRTPAAAGGAAALAVPQPNNFTSPPLLSAPLPSLLLPLPANPPAAAISAAAAAH